MMKYQKYNVKNQNLLKSHQKKKKKKTETHKNPLSKSYQGGENLYVKNYKTIKDIKAESHKWKDSMLFNWKK